MYLNDQLGDCTIAGAAHLEELWTSQATVEVIPSDADVLAAYEAAAGYNPDDPNTDQGACLIDVLNYWRNKGIAGHKIMAYVKVDHTDLDHVKAALMLFGGLYGGVQLPASAMPATDAGQVWADTTDTNIEGGHCIDYAQFDVNGLTCITWGQLQKLTWEWFLKYTDELYAIISADWINASGTAPSGFNLNQLQVDLKLVT
jgi:hypothetical protein